MNVVAACRLAGRAVRFECRHNRVDVARRQRGLVLGHHTRRPQLRIGLQHWGAVRVTARQRPAAVVHPQLVDPSIGLAVGDDRDRKPDPSGVTIEVDNGLLKPMPLHDHPLDILDRDDALAEHRLHFVEVRLECPRAPDAAAYWVVQFGLAGERPNQRI